jgi:uncharacterized protein (DUF433 family)
MVLKLKADPLPLHQDESGTIRVGDSRLTLDVFLEEYKAGASPAALLKAFDTLTLADIHAVIAYYERHRNALDAYLARREREVEKIERALEATGIIWRDAGKILSARRKQRRKSKNASAGN